jgi:Glu-tRNA(Gln) amidotransferase subunit E-like FAD-binding protein
LTPHITSIDILEEILVSINKNSEKLSKKSSEFLFSFLGKHSIDKKKFSKLLKDFFSDCKLKGIEAKQDHFVRWSEKEMKKITTTKHSVSKRDWNSI